MQKPQISHCNIVVDCEVLRKIQKKSKLQKLVIITWISVASASVIYFKIVAFCNDSLLLYNIIFPYL
jgi:hypothetical protein